MDKFLFIFGWIFVGLLLNVIIYVGVKGCKKTPVVYWSVSQQACEKIVKNGKDFNCSEIDSLNRYEKVYIK